MSEQQSEEQKATTSNSEQTSVDPDTRKTGSGAEEETVQEEASVEAGESSPTVAGDANQGTESR